MEIRYGNEVLPLSRVVSLDLRPVYSADGEYVCDRLTLVAEAVLSPPAPPGPAGPREG